MPSIHGHSFKTGGEPGGATAASGRRADSAIPDSQTALIESEGVQDRGEGHVANVADALT